MTFYHFVVKKEHLFPKKYLWWRWPKNSNAIKDIETYRKNFKIFIKCSLLLDKYYNRNREIDNANHDCIETIIENDLNDEYETFVELYDAIKEI